MGAKQMVWLYMLVQQLIKEVLINFFWEFFFLDSQKRKIHDLYTREIEKYMWFQKRSYTSENERLKNGISIIEGSPTNFGGHHNVFEKNILGASRRHFHKLIDMKNWRICMILKKGL